MNQECWRKVYGSSDSAQNSMEFWDYTVELECLKGQDDLQLAAEIGKRLLERNRELENVIRVQQSTLDDQCLQLEHISKQANDARELSETRLRVCEQLESTVAELERMNQSLRRELRDEKQRSRSLSETVTTLESRSEECHERWESDVPRFTPPPMPRRRRSEPPWKLVRQLRLERQPSKEYRSTATMTDDLFDDERMEVQALEASFLRELDRRLANSESEIERLQEEIGTLLIRLAESEGRARDEAEHAAELELKVQELTKLITVLTTPPDPRRLDDQVIASFERGNEMSLEEEFRLSGDFDDVSSGIQSDLDSSLTTRDVTPEVEDRKVTAWNQFGNTNDNTHSSYFDSDFLLHSQGANEEEPLSILYSNVAPSGISGNQSTGTPSNISCDLKHCLTSTEEKIHNECDARESLKDVPCAVQDENGKEKVPTQEGDCFEIRENSQCENRATKGEKRRGRKRRRRICNGVFHSKPVEKVPEMEEMSSAPPLENNSSAMSKPFRELFGVCKIVGTFALCYIVNTYFELTAKDQNPIADLAPPIFVVNDSVSSLGS